MRPVAIRCSNIREERSTFRRRFLGCTNQNGSVGFIPSEQMPCIQARRGHFDYANSSNRKLRGLHCNDRNGSRLCATWKRRAVQEATQAVSGWRRRRSVLRGGEAGPCGSTKNSGAPPRCPVPSARTRNRCMFHRRAAGGTRRRPVNCTATPMPAAGENQFGDARISLHALLPLG